MVLTLLSGVFFASIMGGAFAFGISFNAGTNAFWDHWNKGVCGLYSLPIICGIESNSLANLWNFLLETMERHPTQVH